MTEKDPPARSRGLIHRIVPLLVGMLLGFIGGYFAAGGGRPGGESARAEGSAAGDSLGQLRQQIDRDPQNPKLWTALGNVYYDRENWDKSIEAYEKARRKAPKDPNLLSDLGAAYRNRGDLRRAVDLFEKARAANADHWQSLLNLVLVTAYDLRDQRAAERHFRELKQRYPEMPNLDRIERQITTLGSAKG